MRGSSFILSLVLIVSTLKCADHIIFHDRYLSFADSHAQKNLMTDEFKAKRQEKISKLTKEEQYKIKEALLRQVYSSVNEEIIMLRDGRRFEGVKTGEDERTVTFKQRFGKSGALESRIEKGDIVEEKPLTQGTVNITDDEVLIKKDFPKFNFNRDGEYSFFSDEDYFRAKAVASLLMGLRDGIQMIFKPVMEDSSDRRIYVLVFGDGGKFYELCNAVAPYLNGAVGFYSPSSNYLVVYDFFNGKSFREFNSDLRKVQKGLGQEDAAALQSAQSRFALDLKAENIAVVRHEGSHQLSYDYGIFKDGKADIWLLEGFAEYGATPYIGKLRQEHVDWAAQAIKANRYMPLSRLFELSNNAAFYQQGPEMTTLAYAESWAYFYYLMQPPYRQKFFDYLTALKKLDSKKITDRSGLLAEKIGFSLENLDDQVKDFIQHNSHVKTEEHNS